jgi:adenylyltransferase/sulfurtransferase
MPFCLSENESLRYRRQLIMPEIGASGQRRLKQATVLIAGLGGLGSLSAFYMAAAGVGHLKIVDMDRVAASNLNRQLLHATPDIGKRKTDSARDKLTALNPDCHIETLSTRIADDTVTAMARGCRLILDGTDNLPTRRILNRAARHAQIPFVLGAVGGFDGMVATFIPGQSGCVECLFPGDAPSAPDEIGIIGPTAGVIASLQCVEAVKILVGIESDLAGALIHFHGLGMRIHKSIFAANPDCPVCSQP